ncbi:hypothetical protein PARHAE_00436 [Paracoccus haematequi]|uniref:Uncharacterized protein n=1 Tax=Paracoccus haematequi TaxID=2491866 RepID=A0A3S5D3T4_9RHOB|nr:hypothetical protein [Paracoccus haematequi]VDS07261.1 hypothetical protein PARHAE_00436 [Paracoccus haematequi]
MSLVARITSLAQRDALTVTGIALTAAWLFLVALFWLLVPEAEGSPGGIARLATVMGTILPLALIWLAVGMARALAVLRAEAADLRLRLSQMRDMAATRGAPPRAALPDADEAEPQPRPVPAAVPAAAAASRAAPRQAADPRPQPTRGSGEPRDPIDAETLIRALNFPDGADDAPAIAALRAALQDPGQARVLRAAQDVVTLLAGQDLYMDDLPPDPAPAAVWRRFAAGERGSAVAALGGIQDPLALDIAASLLRKDEIFRDTTHHFLRHFDAMLARHLPQMDDAQVAVLAQTRSARAFMLLGRISGIFG